MPIDMKKQAEYLAFELYWAVEDIKAPLSSATINTIVKKTLGISTSLPDAKLPHYTKYRIENLKGLLVQEGWLTKSTDNEQHFFMNREKFTEALHAEPTQPRHED